MLLLPQHLNLMLREISRSGERFSWPTDCPNGVHKLHHKRSIDRYLAVPHRIVHLLPHPLRDIKRGTGTPWSSWPQSNPQDNHKYRLDSQPWG